MPSWTHQPSGASLYKETYADWLWRIRVCPTFSRKPYLQLTAELRHTKNYRYSHSIVAGGLPEMS